MLLAQPRARPYAVLAVVLSAAVIDLLDSTITNIAAPTIAADLGGGEILIQWLGAAYALALGVLLVVGGRLGDKYGRRRLFLTGLAGFTVASIACGLAVTPAMLIVSRLVQGAFGALLVPQGFGIVTAVFPREQRARAFSAFAPVLGLSAVSGPILAGFLIQADLLGTGWRAMFLINLVLGGGALIAAHRLLPRDAGDRSVTLDGPGAALLALAMLGLLYGLIDGSGHGWSAPALGSLAAGLVCFALFGRRQVTAPAPLIVPSLLRNRGFTWGLVLSVVFFAAVSGLLYVLSLFMQNGLGYGPLRAALGLAPVAAGIVVASIVCRKLVASLGRVLILAGLLITLAGVGWLLLLGPTPPAWLLALPVLAIGLGMGTCFAAVYDVTIGDVDQHEAGSASGALTAVQQLANAIGAAAVITVFFGSVTAALLLVAAAILICCGLVWLLPRRH